MRLRTAAVVLSCASTLAAQHDDGPYAMRYGPLLTTTVECGGLAGTTPKGLVIRCGDRGTVVFDTELLRVAAAWTDGWLRLRGTAYDGAHGPMPARLGVPLVETAPGPGWAQGGSFDDPRAIPYGPLPAEWGRFEAVQLVADDGVVVEYRIGDMSVREQFAFGADGVCSRTLELGPSAQEQVLRVGEVAGPGAGAAAMAAPGRCVLLQEVLPGAAGAALHAAAGWDELSVGGPAAGDLLDVERGADLAVVPGFAAPNGDLAALCDGDAATGTDFAPPQDADGPHAAARLLVDLRRPQDVARIHLFAAPGQGRTAALRGCVFASDAERAPDADGEDLRAAGWRELAAFESTGLPARLCSVAAVGRPGGFGSLRHLLLVIAPGAPLQEIDVWGEAAMPADAGRFAQQLFCSLHGDTGPELGTEDGRIVLRVPPHAEPLRLRLELARGPAARIAEMLPSRVQDLAVPPIPTTPAAARWGEPLRTRGARGPDDGPFAVDTITIPFDNPFHSRMRTAAFDFFADGRAAVSTWNGDVWVVDGIDDDLDELLWRRFATGLFDPLGLRILDDVVHVLGRDGITRLVDTNGDGEADRHENHCNLVLITPAFHEFAFDLQTDANGDFYFSKGAPVQPGGRGFMTIVPHHGTVLKVARDGSRIEAIATGLRAPNGIGVSPDGVVTTGDNEGTFMPRCRINWIDRPGFYAGVKDTAHRTPVPDAPDLPLCWLPMDVDNSSGGQVWVDGAGWPDLQGRLLHLSYGTCSVFLVHDEVVNGTRQGGVVRLPVEFSSSCMRGRFSAHDGQLYVIGLQGWQTNASREGGFHRVRRTAAPLSLPVAVRTCTQGVVLTFAEPLDVEVAADLGSYGVEIWNYRYSPNYGSPEVSVLEPERQVASGKPNRDPLPVTGATLSRDRRTVFVAIDGMRPVHQMRIAYDLEADDGRVLAGEVYATIHALAEEPGFAQER